MFCDLVDWSRFAKILDPEDLSEVIRIYRDTCAEVIDEFQGRVAQYLGDGIMAYFGYPQAHEDDPERAVLTALLFLGSSFRDVLLYSPPTHPHPVRLDEAALADELARSFFAYLTTPLPTSR